MAHSSSGVSALVCAIVIIGQRKGYGTEYRAPHNLSMTLLGTGLLWFGFNAGSALGANGIAAGAFLATVTPGAGYAGPISTIIIGGFAGVLCYFAVVWKGRFGYDDSLDVVGIHGVGGIFDILAMGLDFSQHPERAYS